MKPREGVLMHGWGRILLLLALSIALFISPVSSQETESDDTEDDSSISITGPVDDISTHMMTIYGIQIALAPTHPIRADLQTGDFVRVVGHIDDDDDQVLIAAVEVALTEPDDTEPILIVGTVADINALILTVSGINIVASPEDPLRNDIEIGDVIRVGGLIPEDLDDLTEGITIVAITIIIVDSDDGTPTAEPNVTAAPVVTEEVDDDGIMIVIEGPVQAVNINIIVIYDIEIVLEPDDPVLTVIQIGDIIRVEGVADDDDRATAGITIFAIEITFMSVEVVIIDGFTWRDSGDCGNPPPEIVQAVGGGIEWLIRCDTPPPSVGGGSNDDDDDDGGGGNRGGGGGDNDDDDDDD